MTDPLRQQMKNSRMSITPVANPAMPAASGQASPGNLTSAGGRFPAPPRVNGFDMPDATMGENINGHMSNQFMEALKRLQARNQQQWQGMGHPGNPVGGVPPVKMPNYAAVPGMQGSGYPIVANNDGRQYGMTPPPMANAYPAVLQAQAGPPQGGWAMANAMPYGGGRW